VPSRVYVIELQPRAGKRRDPRIPWVYVGSSARDPEIRFQQHLRGYRSARLVKRFSLRLRPDLYDDLNPIRGSRVAVEAEQARARQLAACGFVAHCDGISHGKGGAIWKEWDAERLRRVASHVASAALELGESVFEPLEPDDCVRLLHGERGFWVERYLDPADPPPEYGRFAHATLEAIQAVLGQSAPTSPSVDKRAYLSRLSTLGGRTSA